MKKLLFMLLSISFLIPLWAQPNIEWQKTYGGSKFDTGRSIEQTSDGGYIMVGYTTSNDGDVSGGHGAADLWVVKLSATGAIEWQKLLGGSGDDFGTYGVQTADGGYIVIGTTGSANGDITGFHGTLDIWVVKLSSVGNIEWQRPLGGTKYEYAGSIKQTKDGGYIIAGRTESNDGDVSGLHGTEIDAWVVKLNENGAIDWQKVYGGSNYDTATSIQQTTDGGYVFSGNSESIDGDVSSNYGSADMWVVKLNVVGDLEWEQTFGGSLPENGISIQQTSDDGFIVTGFTFSSDAFVGYNHGSSDVWVIRLSNTGAFQWEKTLGGSGFDVGNFIQQTMDGGFVLACVTESSDGDVFMSHGSGECWVVKVTMDGEIEWEKALGGAKYEFGQYIQEINNGVYVIIGQTESNNGDVTNYHGGGDCWVIKLNKASAITDVLPQKVSLTLYPNPAKVLLQLQVPTETAGAIVSITSLLGQVMSQQTLSKEPSIDISTLSNGIYCLQVSTASGKVFSSLFQKQE